MKNEQEIPEFKIFVFRAIDEPELCKQYIEGHVKVLTDWGIENITSNNANWVNNPNIYCTGLISKDSSFLLGGIRIQIADEINSLPVEKAVGYLDTKIYNLVSKLRINGGAGELSGLWVSNNLKGFGFGPYLVRASIASSIFLNFKTMIGICAQYSLKMFNNVGFVIDKTLGNKGNFNYPNENYIAHVVGILDALTLKDASYYDKDKMLALRNNPQQEIIENEANRPVKILYNLMYKDVGYLVSAHTKNKSLKNG